MISIVIPAYNSERTISNTLSELTKQTFKNFEVVIVNDGSTDDTESVVIDFINNNTLNIKLVNQNNMGEGEARNTGIRNSSGEFMLFLDADDYLLPRALQSLHNNIVENDFDLVFGSYIYRTASGVDINKKFNDEAYEKQALIEYFFRRLINLGIGNTLFKTEIIKNNNILFGSYKTGADNEFARKFILLSEKGKSISDFTFVYIQNSFSVMNSSYNFNKLDSVYSVLDTKKFIIKNQYPGVYLKWLNIFLINEVKSNGIGYVIAMDELSLRKIRELKYTILSFLPKKIELGIFFSRKRLKWLLMLFSFYHFPILSLLCIRMLNKLFKIKD
jgi:glycosyltransferase involved in cell wall biosynthesis